ncbi:hypothetical protein ACFW9F_30340, partial [Streptomyces sp. NPDC059506]
GNPINCLFWGARFCFIPPAHVTRGGGGARGRPDPVDAAMREVLGVGLEEFTEDWRAYTLEELS